MDLVALLPVFVVAVVLISASPGPAMALIMRRAALRGFAAAVPTVLGLEAGLYLWALFAGAGLAAMVAASEAALLVLRVVGAGLLIYLGITAWRSAWQSRRRGSVAHLPVVADDAYPGGARPAGGRRRRLLCGQQVAPPPEGHEKSTARRTDASQHCRSSTLAPTG